MNSFAAYFYTLEGELEKAKRKTRVNCECGATRKRSNKCSWRYGEDKGPACELMHRNIIFSRSYQKFSHLRFIALFLTPWFSIRDTKTKPK